jgi:hypothetical protein
MTYTVESNRVRYAGKVGAWCRRRNVRCVGGSYDVGTRWESSLLRWLESSGRQAGDLVLVAGSYNGINGKP